jgi:hypothetical protein
LRRGVGSLNQFRSAGDIKVCFVLAQVQGIGPGQQWAEFGNALLRQLVTAYGVCIALLVGRRGQLAQLKPRPRGRQAIALLRLAGRALAHCLNGVALRHATGAGGLCAGLILQETRKGRQHGDGGDANGEDGFGVVFGLSRVGGTRRYSVVRRYSVRRPIDLAAAQGFVVGGFRDAGFTGGEIIVHRSDPRTPVVRQPPAHPVRPAAPQSPRRQ